MRKAISYLVLICSFAAHGLAVQHPVPIVAKRVNLKNQTADIPPTVLVSPTMDSLYRITAYAIPTKTDGASSFSLLFSYSDEVGPEFQRFELLANTPGCNQELSQGYNCTWTATVRVAANSPLTYQVAICDGCSITYDAYITVERLD
jgi:hypothetical protein